MAEKGHRYPGEVVETGRCGSSTWKGTREKARMGSVVLTAWPSITPWPLSTDSQLLLPHSGLAPLFCWLPSLDLVYALLAYFMQVTRPYQPSG